MKGMFILYLSLAVGYALCVAAKKQEGVLRTLGYTLGAGVIILSLVQSLVMENVGYHKGMRKGGTGGMMSKMNCPMMKK